MQSQSYYKRSSRYRRHKDFLIKPIGSDYQDHEEETFLEKYSQGESLDICFEEVQSVLESGLQPLQKKRRKKLSQRQFTSEQIDSTLSGWADFKVSSIPQSCLSILKETKKQSYDEILVYFNSILKGVPGKRIIFIRGQQQTGKKTLLLLVLQELKLIKNQQVKCYFIDFESTKQRSLEEVIKLYQHLQKRSQQNRNADCPMQDIFVINTFHSFLYLLKKLQLLHSFKNILMNTRTVLVFVDRFQFKNKKDSWLQEQSKIVDVPLNNLNFLASSLTAYINDCQWEATKWTIAQPLSMFFCSKAISEGHSHLNLIANLHSFLKKQQNIQPHDNDQFVKQSKRVTRDLLQNFKEQFFKLSPEISILKLSIHEKLVLISCFIFLRAQEQVKIPVDDLYKVYIWVCESLSLQARSSKELSKEAFAQLQTYKMIKTLRKSAKGGASAIILLLQLQQIKTDFENDLVFSKFFEEVTPKIAI